jgi:2-polyprenyl-6-methoxyphenol hydroxylase-like FAD-dependent oxidoreductase
LKVIVIGAGIGGLATGIALKRAGFEVSVRERMSELREVGSGLTLWVNAMRALGQIGAAEAVRERGSVCSRIENRRWRGGALKTLPIHRVGDKYGVQSVSIHRGDLQRTLADVLGGVSLRLGVPCAGFSQDGEGVTVRFGDGSEERADLLVGADGINSTVRTQLFGKPQPRYSGYTCWRSAAKIEHPALEPTVYTQLYGKGSNFGIFPIGGGRWSWYGTMTTRSGEVAGDGPTWKRQARQQFEQWYEPVRAVIEATPENAFIRQDIFDLKPIDTWGSGRVVLLGDAAHATTPALGQGGCMAIEDAVVLAKSLSAGGDVPSALARYVERRRKRANGIVRQARRHGSFYHAANPVLGVVRDVFLRTAPIPIAMREVDKLMGYEV